MIKESVQKAGIRMEDLDCIAFTKGMSCYPLKVVRDGTDEQDPVWVHHSKSEHWS